MPDKSNLIPASKKPITPRPREHVHVNVDVDVVVHVLVVGCCGLFGHLSLPPRRREDTMEHGNAGILR
jgi:hypothetical protein